MKHLFHLIRMLVLPAGIALTGWLVASGCGKRSRSVAPPHPATNSGLAVIWRGHLEQARLLGAEEKFNLLMPGLDRLRNRLRFNLLFRLHDEPPSAVEVRARGELEDLFVSIQHETAASHTCHCFRTVRENEMRM
ncbi:MAG: hypothetical protein K9N23_21165 [Akkermansiaceae bacterium]|nr:hypothetical protein [Akkermansiaceae bacterium]